MIQSMEAFLGQRPRVVRKGVEEVDKQRYEAWHYRQSLERGM